MQVEDRGLGAHAGIEGSFGGSAVTDEDGACKDEAVVVSGGFRF